jgi:hypothetical protein
MVEQEIHDLENSRYRAMVSNDLSTLDKLLADDLVYTHSTGAVDGKSSYLESLRSGMVRYISAERQQESFRAIGEAVLLHGRMKAHVVVGGVEKALDNVFNCVWARTATGWQMINWASTPVATQR